MAKAKRRTMTRVVVVPWRAQDDLRTIQQAAEIQGDKSRLAAVKKQMAEQQAALKKLT